VLVQSVTFRVVAALAIVYVVWGSTYLGIAVAIRTMPPLLMLAARFLVAGALLYVWARRRAVPRPTLRDWRKAAVSGGLLLLGGTGAVAVAEQTIDSGVAALLVASMPLWLALFDRKALRPSTVLGLALGFGGVGLLVSPSAGVFHPASLIVLGGAISWAIGSLLSRGTSGADPALGSGMQMLAGGALIVVAGLARGEAADLQVPSWASLGALAYLALFGSLVAFTAYTWLLRNARTSLVGTYAFANPIVAVLLGFAFLGEPLTWTTAIAGSVIVAGVALIVTPKRERYSHKHEVVRPALGQAPLR
jgi:drug/metabolite transporter (DMT)-like permease